MTAKRLASCRRGAVSVLFATALIPILGLCGLAVDYAMWCEIDASLYKAVNVAALNAVKIAASGDLNNDPNYVAEAKTAGTEWFLASALSTHPSVSGGSLTVSITGTTSLTATVTYSGGTISSTFGKLFGVKTYPFTETAASTINTAPYLEVVLMLDNSSSMDIGATPDDIETLSTLSPCDASNAFTGTYNGSSASKQGDATWTNGSEQSYAVYDCTNYDGGLACPVQTPSGMLKTSTASGGTTSFKAPYTLPFTQFYTTGTSIPPLTATSAQPQPIQSCTNLPAVADSAAYQNSKVYPISGAPCAFACHWTTSTNSDGTTQDLYGMARRYGVTLRLDEVKRAANNTIQQMANDNLVSFNNLSVGVYTFNTTVKQIYPNPATCTRQAFGCEAASDFAAAQTAVGTPPVLPSVADSGIVPGLAQRTGNNYDTAFPEDMTNLANNYVTKAGNGVIATAPLKVLFLVTDGFQDDPNDSSRKAFDPSYCTPFKNMGYQVYVVYTPYYPVMHSSYLQNPDWIPIVEGPATSDVTLQYNLTACSSQSTNPSGTYYISAQNQTQLNAALTAFLKQALNSPARYTN